MMTFKRVAILATALFVGSLFAGPSWGGTIKGKVTVQGIRSPENIAVYVDAVPGKDFPAPAHHIVVDQKKMTFVPHVAVVLKGTTVDFLNSDAVGHNVYWPSISGNKKLAHNLGTWPQGQKKSFQFTDLGAAALLCNVHPEMSGYIIVSPSPYFAQTDAGGNYKIADVPDGTYTAYVWQEGAKLQSKPVTVAKDTKADFSVSK